MTVYKRTDFTNRTIKSILQCKKNKIELLVLLDNPGKYEIQNLSLLQEKWDPKDGTMKIFIQKTDKKINGLWNHAFELASNENVFVINDDVEFTKNFDKIIQEHLENNIVNPVFRTPNDEGLRYKDNNISGHARATTKTVREKLGNIDERLRLWYGDDFIFQNAIDHGIKIEWINDVEVFHHESKTLGREDIKEEVDETIKQDQENWKTILKEKGRFDFRFQ